MWLMEFERLLFPMDAMPPICTTQAQIYKNTTHTQAHRRVCKINGGEEWFSTQK